MVKHCSINTIKYYDATIFIAVSAHLLVVGYFLQDVEVPITSDILLSSLQNFMMMSYPVLTSMTDMSYLLF